MNGLQGSLLMEIAPRIIDSVVRSILSEKTLVAFRDRLFATLRTYAGATESQVDDVVVETTVKIVLDPGKSVEHTIEFCKIMKDYLQSDGNDWKDFVFVPILDQIESIGCGMLE